MIILDKTSELKRVLLEVRKQMQYTVLSYPERDPHGWKWGNPGYNGNCTGKIPLGFIDKFHAKNVFEMYAGSGTLSDVCADYGYNYCGVDLNPNPVRSNIVAMDLCDMNQEFPMEIYDADFIFQHPVYPGIKRIKYAGSAWVDTNNLAERDIQNMPFEKGMQKINLATMRAYSAMKPGGLMAILVGEVRADGCYYSMMHDLALPGEFYQSYVKLQHNTYSDRNGQYGNSTRALTGHEMIAVIKKPSGYEIAYVVPKQYVMDIRDSKTATWKDVVVSVMRNLGSSDLSHIYSEIEKNDKTSSNPNWKAKVRQTLQILQEHGVTKNVESGVWAMAAA